VSTLSTTWWLRAFFGGETLNKDTPILVPDTGELPVALNE
jgi:hypothetical protein